jgi:Transposase IS116/IS110/IS902 family
VAVTVVAEVGELTRVDHPRPLMRDVGLTPSAYSSGARRRQDSMTQTGNTQARRALVEGAWASRDPANVSRHLHLRLEKRPKAAQEISGKAPGRLGTRDRKRSARGDTRPSSRGGQRPRTACLYGGHGPSGSRATLKCSNRPCAAQQRLPSEGTRPRSGVTRDGVTRPAGTRAPRWRPAPDGRPSGGTQPTAFRRSTRRL